MFGGEKLFKLHVIIVAVTLSFMLLIAKTGLRVFGFQSIVFIPGVQALKHLLRCAVPVKSTSQSFRKYEKPGNVKTAIQDFYSIDPQNSKRMIFGIYKKSKPVRRNIMCSRKS